MQKLTLTNRKQQIIVGDLEKPDGDIKRQHWFQMEECLQHDLLPDADKLVMPALFIVGSEDLSCLPEHIQILFDAVASQNKQIHVIEGAPHSFYKESEQDECKKVITEWLRER